MATKTEIPLPIAQVMETLIQDYARFPDDQTFALYDPQVQFRDPMSRIRGREQFQTMIAWMQRWFRDLRLELHDIRAEGSLIHTRWRMRWIAPLPWQPAMVVTGRSELKVNEQGLIAAQTDYWDCSRWQLLQQLWSGSPSPG